MPIFLRIIGYAILFLLPFVFLFVSVATDNFRYFFYALSASLAALLTASLLKRMK
jgi:hypothetical protein